MAQDVSVKSVDLLKGYNSRIKTFNSSVNTLIYAFRRKAENLLSQNKSRLRSLEGDYEASCRMVDDKIRKYSSLLAGNNWHPESEAKINNELHHLREIRLSLDAQMANVRQDYSNLSLQIDQLLQSATSFGLSNQNLLDSNIKRMETVTQYIDTYKSDTVK
jgi:uncharacterized coiled-coil DUF342 family protein